MSLMATAKQGTDTGIYWIEDEIGKYICLDSLKFAILNC